MTNILHTAFMVSAFILLPWLLWRYGLAAYELTREVIHAALTHITH